MRTKIDFGIDLGTTNSAISKMENGKPTVITTGRAEIIPSCVAFLQEGRILVGERARHQFIKDKEKQLRNGSLPNSFIEFKREMSNPTVYESSVLKKSISPEELSAEVLKYLKSFVTNEILNSIVITVPAKFNIAQNEATIRAGKIAGFELIELLQEPIAACLAFSFETNVKKGTFLVFDFGGGTFDAAIVKKDNDGMMRVIDTGGDNELGGKDLDLAIVDNLIMPYLQNNYALESFYSDSRKKDLLRFALKKFAEDAKIELTFQHNTDLLKTYPGDIELTDDNGKEICLNIDFSREDLHRVLKPFHQKAIDLSLKVMNRKNISKTDIDALILVGGPTMSPVFQEMIKEQISEKIDTSINPMTIVAKGAALYASTKDSIPPSPIDNKVFLDIKYDAATIQEDTLINIKINKDKTEMKIPDKVRVVFERTDKGFSTEKEISISRLKLIELLLNKGVVNIFKIRLIDEKGNNIPCMPDEITIIPEDIPEAVLSYFIGIEIWDPQKELSIFRGLNGLEKNQISKNAVGVITSIKTPNQIVPGKSNDRLEIRIFQGEEGAEGKDIFLSDHVTSVIITGMEAEKLIPANSELEVTLRFNQNGSLPLCTVYFPNIDWTHQVQLNDFKRSEVDAEWLYIEMQKDQIRIENALEKNPNEKLNNCLSILEELKESLKNNEGNNSGRITVLNNLRKNRIDIETNISDDEWPEVSEELKIIYYNAEDLVEKCKNGELYSDNLDMDKVESHLEDFRVKTEQIIVQKETHLAKEVIEEIRLFILSILDETNPGIRERSFIKYINTNFASIIWTNSTKARQLINQAINIINNNGSNSQLRTLCLEIDKLIDRTVKQPPIPQPN
jgi:molecular chaperone DnaK